MGGYGFSAGGSTGLLGWERYSWSPSKMPLDSPPSLCYRW